MAHSQLRPATARISKGFIDQSDPMVWRIVNGQLYLFSAAERMPAVALALHVPYSRLSEITKGERTLAALRAMAAGASR